MVESKLIQEVDRDFNKMSRKFKRGKCEDGGQDIKYL